MNRKSVLFLCTGNSARSQIAETLLRYKAAELFDVYSAGAAPEAVHPSTYKVLEKFGVSSGSLESKSVDVFQDQEFDYVITLCDHASNECKSIPYQGMRLEWSFPDPKKASEASYDLEPFESCVLSISRRVDSFIELESKHQSDLCPPALDPVTLFKSLSDRLRLKCLMLVQYEGELCVCELMQALQDSQPKVSRHLALLRKEGLLKDRREGQWVFYRINPALPSWAKSILAETTDANIQTIKKNLSRLHEMGDRPSRSMQCCN